MELVPLVSTSRASALATVSRLRALAIDAQVIDDPNLFVRLTSGGNYRVRVLVAREDLERARAELARWEAEARPRLDSLARETRRGFLWGSIPAAALLLWLLLRSDKDSALWLAVVPAWLAGLLAWALWSRRRTKPGHRED
jgi:hypothetical protein